jgi:hypothetical protein
VFWLGAATHLANAQGLGMAVLEWRLMGAHGLYLLPQYVDAASDPRRQRRGLEHLRAETL